MKKTLLYLTLLSLTACNFPSANESQKEVVEENGKASAEQTAENDMPINEKEIARATKELQFVFGCLRYEYVNQMKDEEIIRKAVEGALSTLDPHTCYLNEKALSALKDHTDGEFGGLGIEIIVDEKFIRIISPVDDTPAYDAGLKSGDLIISIDDECIAGISAEEAVAKLRGKPGSKVKLKIKRQDKTPFDITVKRAMIKIKSVKTEVLNNIGYVRISTFDKNTSTLLKKFLTETKGLRGIILDVRNNPGGLLDEAVEVSNMFLKGGKIVSTKGRTEANSQEFVADDKDLSEGIPLVVLINNGTASAPEILAGALRDNHRAIIVGTRSFGKGSVQKVIPLSEKTAVKITVAKHYTPSGECIQAQGISPDIVADYAEVNKIDDVFVLREEFFSNALDAKEASKKHPNAKKLPDFKEEKKSEEKPDELLFRKMPLKDRVEKDYQLGKAFDVVNSIHFYEKLKGNKSNEK